MPQESERIMNVDFNNMRVQAAYAYNRLFDKFCELKDGIENNNKKDSWSRKDNLKDEIDAMVDQFLELRMLIHNVCAVYDDDGGDMKDVSKGITFRPTQKWLSQYDPEAWGSEDEE